MPRVEFQGWFKRCLDHSGIVNFAAAFALLLKQAKPAVAQLASGRLSTLTARADRGDFAPGEVHPVVLRTVAQETG